MTLGASGCDQWVWSLGLVSVFSVWGAVGVVSGSNGCVQCVGAVGVVAGCGQWVVDILFTS